MHVDPFLAFHLRLGFALTIASVLYGCAAPAEPASQAARVPVTVQASAPPAEPAPPANAQPTQVALAYADYVRGLQPVELGEEILRLGDGGDSAVQVVQLALALVQSRTPANSLRAQMLLRRVLGDTNPQAIALRPLAALMAAQLADTRRAEEQIERQGQQLRDAQRRIDHLHDRLEAVRSIERSLPSRPAASATARPSAAP